MSTTKLRANTTTAEEGAEPTLAEDLLAAMSAIRRAGRRYLGRPVELSLLTGAQLELVRLVRRRPGISIAEAASDLRVAPNTVSTLVRALTDKALMVRYVDHSDRRVARLDLTADMRHKVDAWRDRRADALTNAFEGLSTPEKQNICEAVRSLWLIADDLEAQGEPR